MPVRSLLFAIVLAGALPAAGPFYLGTWKIDSAAVAPWWTDAGKPDAAESQSLVGKTVVFTPGGIAGPGILACQGPHYKMVDVPPKGLFQGAFDEMHRRDSHADPVKLAAPASAAGPGSRCRPVAPTSSTSTSSTATRRHSG